MISATYKVSGCLMRIIFLCLLKYAKVPIWHSIQLKNLQTILERLVEISKQELENKELSQDDYDFIKNFGKELNGVIADVEDKAKKTSIIADVHTDINTEQVLEEGCLHLLPDRGLHIEAERHVLAHVEHADGRAGADLGRRCRI